MVYSPSANYSVSHAARLVSVLRPYQKVAANFLAQEGNFYAGLEMGLGKSLISLAVINRLKMPTLIVAPKAVCLYTWPEEIAKWLPGLTYSSILGTAAQRGKAAAAEAQVHIINYENLPWLIAKHPWKWELVIFDEISKMKSRGTRTKAFASVRAKVKKVIGLSGTPAANSLEALFCQYLALDGGETFGKFITHFREEYMVNRGYNFPDWQFRPGAEVKILDKVRPTMLTMRAADYLKELPRVVTTTHYFELSAECREQYREMEKDSVLEEFDIMAGTAAVKSGKLRQVVSGFAYDEESAAHFVSSDKMDHFEEILDELSGEQVLVFYQFKEEERLLRKWATPIDGHAIDKWNRGELRCMMGHPNSAGHGINLQKSGAHHIIFVSIPWDAENYLQAIGRLLRSGNKANTVFVHNLIAKDTIDEKVVATLEQKLAQHNRLMRSA